jgi:hypothetical protein
MTSCVASIIWLSHLAAILHVPDWMNLRLRHCKIAVLFVPDTCLGSGNDGGLRPAELNLFGKMSRETDGILSQWQVQRELPARRPRLDLVFIARPSGRGLLSIVILFFGRFASMQRFSLQVIRFNKQSLHLPSLE